MKKKSLLYIVLLSAAAMTPLNTYAAAIYNKLSYLSLYADGTGCNQGSNIIPAGKYCHGAYGGTIKTKIYCAPIASAKKSGEMCQGSVDLYGHEFLTVTGTPSGNNLKNVTCTKWTHKDKKEVMVWQRTKPFVTCTFPLQGEIKK